MKPQSGPDSPVQKYSTTQATSQYPCWYIPPGVSSVFGSKKGIVTLDKGWLSLIDTGSSEEIYKYELAPDIKLGNLFGQVRIAFMNGQKNKLTDYRYLFYFYNPKVAYFARFLFSGRKQSKNFSNDLRQAAGVE